MPSINEANTQINVEVLEKEILDNYEKLTEVQRFNMQRTIDTMRNGADALIDDSKLNFMEDENSKSVLQTEVAQFYTDQLATMVKKRFVCGPYDPEDVPVENLRLNSLFAVNQADKYRPILNLSKPEGNSFNEAIIPAKMRKVKMSTARQVADTIFDSGQDSVISKIDHVSAYKLIPVKREQFYLQGFKWLGKIFFEVRLIFGSRSSVPNYDDFHDTVSDLVKVKSNTDRQFLHRTLDDQIHITPSQQDNESFINTNLELAEKINLPLADMTGEDKAFLFRTSGTVLGINFNTKSMTWSYSNKKRLAHMKILQTALFAPLVTNELLMKVMGVINTLVIMCPALRFLRSQLIIQLGDSYHFSPLALSSESANLLHLWLHIFQTLKDGFPITKTLKHPPAIVLTFISDAAGLPDPKNPPSHQVGVGAAGYLEPYPKILYTGQVFWPKDFIEAMDKDNKSFGCKTTLLETIGLLIPLFHNAHLIRGRHVLMLVDNIGSVWGYAKGRSKMDPYTSVILTALNHVALSYSCYLYVHHCPRVSTTAAILADSLSRSDNKGRALAATWCDSLLTHWPPSLLSWMNNPSMDWMLGSKLVRDFIQSEEIGWFSLFGMLSPIFILFTLFGRLKDCFNGNLSYMINKLMYVGNM